MTYAATYYWEGNTTAGGYGTATGTWADPTTGNATQGWTTATNATTAPDASRSILIGDDVNFGNGATGLGAGTISVSGTVNVRNITFASGSGAIVLSGGTINLGATSTITVNNATDTISSSLTGAGTSLTKAGTGTLVLTGASSYTGSTIINSGTLNLGGGGSAGSLASTVLTLSGGTFSFTRNDNATESFTTTNINSAPVSVFNVAAGNTLELGNVVRANGVTLDFSTGLGSGTLKADASSNTGGIMAGFNFGDTWAVANGAGSAISGLADLSYTSSTAAGTSAANYTGNNIDVNNSPGTLDAGITANSLRFSTSGANTLSLTGANVLTTGGILVGSAVGGNLSTITGGTLTGAANKDLVIIQNNTSGGLTISSNIINSTSTSVTKGGAGLLTLSGTNSFTGGVYINGGTLALGSAGALNSTAGSENAVNFGQDSTGTLRLAGNGIVVSGLNTNATGAGTAIVENASGSNITLTIGNSANASSTFAGVIQDGAGGGTLALTKVGTGTLTLTGANTYTGGTTLTGGTVAISNATSLGAGAVSVTGNSRINAVGGVSYANSINITGTNVLSLQNSGAANSTTTFSGAITGSSGGGVTLVPGPTGANYTVDLTNTGNTFTGNLTLATSANANDFINFASIGDGGSIVFGRSGWRSVASYTGSAALNLSARSISLATTFGGATGFDGGGNPINMFANNGTGVATFAQDMVMTTTASSGFFFLGGSNTGNNTFSGRIADPTGATTLGIGKWDAGKWILSNANNSFEGNILLGNGTLSVAAVANAGNAQALGQGTLIQLGQGAGNGTLEITGATNSSTDKQIVLGSNNNNHAGQGGILNNGTGSLTFTNTTFNSITQNSGLTTRDRTLTLGGSNTGANVIQGAIQDHVTGNAQILLSKSDAGTWVLSGTNTYTGTTTINGGILQFSKQVSLYNNTTASWIKTNIIVNSGGTLALNVGGTGEFTTTDVSTILTNLSTTINNNGLRSGSTIGFDTTNASGGTFTIADNMANSTGTGGGAIGLTKRGTGTLILSGTNTYTGATTVSGGTLAVNGSITSAVTVASGATLQGSGTISSSVTINGGGTLAAGNSIDSLASGNLTLAAAAIFAYEMNNDALAGVAGDLTAVTGNLTLDVGNASILTLSELGSGSWTAGESLTLISYSGTWNGGLFTYSSTVINDGDTINFSGMNWLVDYNDTSAGTNYVGDLTGTSFVTMTAIPEPGVAMLGGLSLLGLLLRRRRA